MKQLSPQLLVGFPLKAKGNYLKQNLFEYLRTKKTYEDSRAIIKFGSRGYIFIMHFIHVKAALINAVWTPLHLIYDSHLLWAGNLTRSLSESLNSSSYLVRFRKAMIEIWFLCFWPQSSLESLSFKCAPPAKNRWKKTCLFWLRQLSMFTVCLALNAFAIFTLPPLVFEYLTHIWCAIVTPTKAIVWNIFFLPFYTRKEV